MVPANTLVPSLHYQSFTDETKLFGSHENKKNQDLVRQVFLVLTIQTKIQLMMCLKFFQTVKQNDCNWTRTQNHLVCKRTLNHLAKLTK